MTIYRDRVRMAVLATVLACCGAGIAHGQMASRPSPNNSSPNLDPSSDRNGNRVPPEIRERMEKARVDERQKRLMADTDKLLALATSLKSDMDKTDKNMLSIEVIRRSEEIEKLARTIREREKQ